MLFNSFEFIFVFLPIALLGYTAIRKWLGIGAGFGWLLLASLFFYSWWNPVYLPLLLASIGVNYLFGSLLMNARWRSRSLLTLGVAANLGALFWFKYAHFTLGVVDAIAGTQLDPGSIVLPLAISFYTFQQIAYLVDAYRGHVQPSGFARYAVFVTFFPQLIAGPIVHHSEVFRQFSSEGRFAPRIENLALGMTIFIVGLFKKVVLADGIAVQSTRLFGLASAGQELDFFLSWTAGLSYTMQMYFDFSSYSDMAVGLARMFGIKLPLNFDSPHKSASLAEMWRRWHITLFRFMRDYLYIPLGGNRHGAVRRYLNVFATIVASGVWHGAGLTYFVFGIYHASLVVLNMVWAQLRLALGLERERAWWDRGLAVALTFLGWTIGLVIFRADSLETAARVLSGMFGMHGAVLPQHWQAMLAPFAPLLQWMHVDFGSDVVMLQASEVIWIVSLMLPIFLLPNIYELTARYDPVLWPDRQDGPRHRLGYGWNPSLRWMLCIALLASLAFANLSNISEFLYFQF